MRVATLNVWNTGGDSGGPSLGIVSCDRTFDGPESTASDHYGLAAELRPAGG